ncbi:MAG: hypothetical protein KUA35_03160 [Pseudodesulfovibrio sp.]|uniref:Lipoprotein n=1 Tax=Pseudodesulfovibrio aespoeensis (strain ATCC 700646 / DSM 10631 / Aspo-2) TaxID=643562 RepID=E6VRR4_PSEA9|nr:MULTISPECIES: hypothetical protein [Pseudodesulfovibrio]MBU4191498.1 hypothetical protein [Pseudomonadota bacterium]ADU64201.1 hypothetical protein Daes_3210 [Pseudodesulfovibrio aespoeensis Aspo-2]MBU4245016.1 hypothetical protein [Pseudomonadota bacterium]MBU4377645.1 hypothetical protein [Pseudomonadota bacterium]MBU4475983.1 hypothetical protein [Pseudomonadota bacterium]
MKQMLALLLAVLLIPAMGWAGGTLPTMPQTVADLVRIELVTGLAAQAEVDTLHGKPLPAEESLVARYARSGSADRPAEVWVSRVLSEAEARRQTGQMVHMMYENPKSPFKNPARLDHKGVAVYRFHGMGQVHLIWYSADLVYWVSAPPTDQPAMLDAFCFPPNP